MVRSLGSRLVFLAVGLGLVMTGSLSAEPSQRMFDVTEYGAVGDGETLNTAAINRAIDACAEAGGGKVLVPAGDFLTGSVVLRSNVTLKIAEGGRLAGTDSLSAYRYLDPENGRLGAKLREEDNRWHRALILGNDIENVKIVGPGVIDGRDVYDPKGEAGMRGPHTVLIGDSRNLTVQGVHVTHSPNYAVFFRGCKNVTVRETKITGGWDAVHFRSYDGRPNRDLRITDSEFYTGDDAIAGRYVEGLHIEDNLINSSCNGIRIIGPAQDMVVRNSTFRGPGKYPHRKQNRTNMLAGILLQPGAWDASPGPMTNVTITDVTMENVTAPLQIYLKREDNTADDIRVENLTATGVYRGALSVESWTDQPVGAVHFENVDLQYAYEEAPDERARHKAQKPHVGARPLPAWGVFAKNVEKLTFEDVKMRTTKADPRPATIFRKVGNLKRHDVSFSSAEDESR